MVCWIVFVTFAMRWLGHFYHSLTSSFFQVECGDVTLLGCHSFLDIKHVFGKILGLKRLLPRAKASIAFNSFFTVKATFLS